MFALSYHYWNELAALKYDVRRVIEIVEGSVGATHCRDAQEGE